MKIKIKIQIQSMIIQKIIKLRNLIKNKIELSNTSLILVILSKLDINVTDSSSTITYLSYRVFMLSSIALLCFIKIINYLQVYVLIQRGKYDSKYPKFINYIKNYYKDFSLIIIAILVIICIICLLMLVIFSLL
jgi:amino acid transporter